MADRRTDLGRLGQQLLGGAGDRGLGLPEDVVDLRVRRLQRSGAQPAPDLLQARDHLGGQVAEAGRDLRADESQQQHDGAQAADDHDGGGELAVDVDLARGRHHGAGQGGDQQRDGQRQEDHREVGHHPVGDVAGGADHERAPRPRRRQVDGPGHLRPAEVARAGVDHDRLRLLRRSLGAELLQLVRDALGEPLVGLGPLRGAQPAQACRHPVALPHDARLCEGAYRRSRRRARLRAAPGCSMASRPTGAST